MSTSKINVLAVFANPSVPGIDALRLEAEDRAIRQAIERSRYRDNISLERCHAATIHDLRHALLDDEFQIVHIAGHGADTGLVLENEMGEPYLVPQQALAEQLQAYSPPIECVILNACCSVTQGQLVTLAVPFTIAMEGSIHDEAAIEFSRGFYDAIGAGKDIEFAYNEGCRAVRLAVPGAQFASRILKARALPIPLPDRGYFYGRKAELEHLEEMLERHQLVIVEGMSGIGKTVLTTEYAYRNLSNYQAVAWCEIQDSDTVKSVLENIASQLENQGQQGLLEVVTNPRKSQSTHIKALAQQLCNAKDLLILDSFENCLADNREIQRDFLLLVMTFLRSNLSSHVLITTKTKPELDPTHLGRYGVLRLSGLAAEEAAQVLLALCQEYDCPVSKSNARQVSKITGGHPFALKTVVQLLCFGYSLSDLLDDPSGIIGKDIEAYLLDALYPHLPSGARKLLEACSAFRRPFNFTAIRHLPASPKFIRDLSSHFLLEFNRRDQHYSIHTIVRSYAYGKLGQDVVYRREVHKAIGDYYASVMQEPEMRQDFQTIQRILEAQYHYYKADDWQGQVAVASHITQYLKPVARQLFKQGEVRTAKRLYKSILKVDDTDSEIHQDYARLLEHEGADPTDIEHHLLQSVRLAPDNPQRQADYLVWMARTGKFKQAKDAFWKAVRHCSWSSHIYVRYAKALVDAGRLQTAEEVLQLGKKRVKPRSLSQVYLAYCDLLLQESRSAEAADLLREGLKSIPAQKGLDDLYVMCSQMLREQGKPDKAAAVLRHGLDRLPQESLAKIYVEYSYVLQAQGLIEEAEQILQEGIGRVSPKRNLYQVYRTYSDLLRSKNDLKGAAAVLKDGIEHVPPTQKADALYLEYSKVMRSLGNVREAERALQEGIRCTPPGKGLTTLYLDYNNLLVKQNRLDEALSRLDEALSRLPRRCHGVLRKKRKEIYKTRSTHGKKSGEH